jgi:hypothetical protein
MADEKFTIVLKKSPDYKIYPGNVVYGGPTPDLQGIVMNFCVDHAPLPSYIQHAVINGKVNSSTVIDQAVAGNLEREVLCGITMSLNQAEALQVWLTKLIEKIKGPDGV